MKKKAFFRIVYCLLIVFHFSASASAQEAEDFIRLPDGVEVVAPSGRLRPSDIAAALTRVESQITNGQLGLAKTMLKAIGPGVKKPAAKAAAMRAKIRDVEFSSIVILRNGQKIEGRLLDPFRLDRLGLETKKEISPDLIRRISVEYHLGWSQVSKTFYPLTIVETEFRNGQMLIGRLAQEVLVRVETRDGRVVKVKMGVAYQLLREERLLKQLLDGSQDRVARILVYTTLNSKRP